MGGDNKMIRKRTGFLKKYRLSSMVKEALDNLPSGICYFDNRGVPLLVNKTMYRLMFMLSGCDIQDISDFEEEFFQKSEVFSEDGRVWQFQKKIIDGEIKCTEIIASDITDLYHKKRELEERTIEQQKIMKHLEEISRDVVSIARNEEILAMKMRIHDDLGYALAETRHFITNGYQPKEKAKYIENHRKVAQKLLGEIGNDDEIDIFSELKTNAEKLGTEIILDGELPKSAEGLLTQAIRECLINAIRHGKGNKVFVKIREDEKSLTTVITNNGKPPSSAIVEAGGLLALRKNIETVGGTMRTENQPEFAVIIILPSDLRAMSI